MEIKVVDEFSITKKIADIILIEAETPSIEVYYRSRNLVKTRCNVVHKEGYEEYDCLFQTSLKGSVVKIGVYGRQWMELAKNIAQRIQKTLPDLDVILILESESVFKTHNKPMECYADACFIATASYGSPLAPQLDILRRFRDACLPFLLVQCYYKLSPPIAQFISGRSKLCRIIRGFLEPLVKLLKWEQKKTK